jgi:hypothetical protein
VDGGDGLARPEIQGLKYFPFDVGFFRDKKIRLLRGEHNSDGVEIYQRLLCKCYEDNGYYLVWDKEEDYDLLAEETGYTTDKVRLIVASCLRRSLFEDKLFEVGNVLTSRSIQRRYFLAIKETKSKAAAHGRYTTIAKNLCLLTEEDISEINKTTVWLKVAQNDHTSPNNDGLSEINPVKSAINPAKEMKGKETKGNERKGEEETDTPPGGVRPSTNPPKHKYGEYQHVLLTDVQYQRFIDEFGNERTLEAIKHLDEYIQMKGYKAKDHNLTIRKWVFKAIDEQRQRDSRSQSSNPAASGNIFYDIAQDRGYVNQ